MSGDMPQQSGLPSTMNWNSAQSRSGEPLKKGAEFRKSITPQATIMATTNTRI